MAERVQFFNDSLIYLSTASNKGFQAFKECATLIKNRLQGFPLELSAEFLDSKLDKVSMDLFPDQDFPDLVPVRVEGDGNCLPRSASMLIFGDQQHHLEMRVRMACELALNKEFYLNNENHKMYEFDTFPYCSMITTYSQHFKPGMDTQRESIEFVFEEDAMKTAKTGTYCGIWHLYALASIVGCRLYSIYPKLKSTVTIRPELNRIIFPRKQMSKKKIAIFWTNTNGIKGESFWSPNHFAPCFQKHSLLQAKQRAALKKCKTQEHVILQTPTRQRIRSSHVQCHNTKPDAPKKNTITRTGTLLRKETLIGVNSPITNSESTTETPKKRAVRFNVESKSDLAINFVNKQAQKIHVKKIKERKNPLKSILKFFLGHQRESRGPDISYYEIEYIGE